VAQALIMGKGTVETTAIDVVDEIIVRMRVVGVEAVVCGGSEPMRRQYAFSLSFRFLPSFLYFIISLLFRKPSLPSLLCAKYFLHTLPFSCTRLYHFFALLISLR
jgi:hypothetical protein